MGTIIMLNPGSAKLKTISIQENKEIPGELSIVPTMESLIKLIRQAYKQDGSLQGRLRLYNLFPLQNTSSKGAIRLFQKLWNEHEPLVRYLPKTRNQLLAEIQSSPWVLLGWICEKIPVTLNNLKKTMAGYYSRIEYYSTWKKRSRNFDYYHPRPRIRSQQAEYDRVLLKQFEDIFHTIK